MSRPRARADAFYRPRQDRAIEPKARIRLAVHPGPLDGDHRRELCRLRPRRHRDGASCDEAAGIAAIRHSGRRGRNRRHRPDDLQCAPSSSASSSPAPRRVNAVWRTSMEVGAPGRGREPAHTARYATPRTAYVTMVALEDEGKPIPVPTLERREPRTSSGASARRSFGVRNRLAERDQIRRRALARRRLVARAPRSCPSRGLPGRWRGRPKKKVAIQTQIGATSGFTGSATGIEMQEEAGDDEVRGPREAPFERHATSSRIRPFLKGVDDLSLERAADRRRGWRVDGRRATALVPVVAEDLGGERDHARRRGRRG